jgi:hypothetical protein
MATTAMIVAAMAISMAVAAITVTRAVVMLMAAETSGKQTDH